MMTGRRRCRSHLKEIQGLRLDFGMQMAGAFLAVDDLTAEAPQLFQNDSRVHILQFGLQAAGAFWAVEDLAAEAPQPQRLAAGPWPGAPHCWALLPPAQSPSGCLEVSVQSVAWT
jgi:hypothetical protein